MAHIKRQTNRVGPCRLVNFGKEHRDNTWFIPNVSSKHLKITPLQQNHAHHSKPRWKEGDCCKEKDFSSSPGAFSLYLLEESAPMGFLHGDSRLCEQQRHWLYKLQLSIYLCLSPAWRGSGLFLLPTQLYIYSKGYYTLMFTLPLGLIWKNEPLALF